MPSILCSIATRGRYKTTLPLALFAVANQTRKPNKLVIFDDNDEPEDLRLDPIYTNLFAMLNSKGIAWEVFFAPKKGQHHAHQMANQMGYDWVWRVDDDCMPEPNVLENLSSYIADDVGAVGGAILTPGMSGNGATGAIKNIDLEPSLQWSEIKSRTEVDHLHCSFIYRAGVYDYNLGLSRVAHREETLFTYGLKKKGYGILAVPEATSWHLKSPSGGIRSETDRSMFAHDEYIFRNFMANDDKTIVVLNCGMGDHIVFSHVLPKIKNPLIFTCYPDIVPGGSIAEAAHLFGDLDHFNIYKKMDQWQWTESLEKAFEKLYL